jgi:hypothetical protein
MSDRAGRYIPLLQALVERKIDAPEFQHRFLDWWREDRDAGMPTVDIIDNLMVGVDCYDENPDVPMRIDADQLRAEIAEALRLLAAR